ncbi:MAG TPA: TetR family transcriptional regulator [Chitinophagaceae bacterium]|nr:TetR family transcriptional regulator [Chitinophagaceae bacterium]
MTDKKTHIINTAIELFAEKGFEGTSIRDIATKADVNVAMINYYFGSKEKLFESMLEQKAAYTRGALEEIVTDKSLSEIEKLDRIIDNYVSKLFTNRKFHRVIHQELMLNEREVLQDAIVNILCPNSVLIRSIIDAGIKTGSFKKVDSLLAIASIIGTINQVLLSKKFCNKLLNKEDGYVPYDDPKFSKRVSDHLKDLMHSYLLKK